MSKRSIGIVLAIVLVSLAVLAVLYFTLFQDSGTGQGGKSGPNPTFEIALENGNVIRGELYPGSAPNTVANFIALANDGFYDGLTFHRIAPGLLIQGGSPDGTDAGGPGYSIKGEFSANGVENQLTHTPGVLSMMHGDGFDSAGSQFFIMLGEEKAFDGEYAAFGKVTEGLSFAEAVSKAETDSRGKPVSEQRIKSIRVETNGKTYPLEKLQ